MSPRWSLGSTADADIISLDEETGRITGKRSGTASVYARYDGMNGSVVRVTVE